MSDSPWINRTIINQVVAINSSLLDITINHHEDVNAPLVSIDEHSAALIHNIQIKENADGITILYFEVNKYITIYDTHTTGLTISSPEAYDESTRLPKFIITLNLISLDKTEFNTHNCVITPIGNKYHCAFIPSNKCRMAF